MVEVRRDVETAMQEWLPTIPLAAPAYSPIARC